MNKFKVALSCLFIILAFLSCSSPKALEYKTFHNFTIQQLGFNKSAVSLELEYFNPNNFGMQLKSTDLDIFIDKNLLGHSNTDTLIHIPPRSSFIVPVNFNVDMKNIFKNAMNALSGKEVLIRLEGKIRAGRGKVFMSIPVKYETRQTFSFF